MWSWPVGRAVKSLVRACGGSSDAARGASLIASWICSPFDPIGAGINAIHTMAEGAGSDGSRAGKVVDGGLSVIVLGDSLAGAMSAGGGAAGGTSASC